MGGTVNVNGARPTRSLLGSHGSRVRESVQSVVPGVQCLASIHHITPMAAGGGLGRFRWTYTSPAILERFLNALGEHDKKITTFDSDRASCTPPQISSDARTTSASPLRNNFNASRSSDYEILAALTGCGHEINRQTKRQPTGNILQ